MSNWEPLMLRPVGWSKPHFVKVAGLWFKYYHGVWRVVRAGEHPCLR